MSLKLMLACLFSLTSLPATAEEIVWNLGYIQATGSNYAAVTESIPARIAKATNNRLKIELQPTLIPAAQQPAAMRDGRLELINAVNPYLSGEAAIFNIGHLPGLVRDEKDYKKIMEGGIAKDIANVWGSRYNGVMLATGMWDEQGVYSNKPIAKAEDWKGLRVRVHNTEAALLMKMLGASPTPVDFTEMGPALQRGVIDAIMATVGTAQGQGLQTVGKYVEIWKIGAAVGWCLVANKDAWAKLPPDLQKIVADEFTQIEKEHYSDYRSFSDTKLKFLVDSGMKLVAVSDDERAKVFSEANVAAIYENFYKQTAAQGVDGKLLVEKAKKLID